MEAARPDIAALYFALYMALVFLVGMNIAIAILTIALEEVNMALKVGVCGEKFIRLTKRARGVKMI